MGNLKVHIEKESAEYTSMFLAQGWTVTSKPDDADLICFTGGSDVSPMLYEEIKHPKTHSNFHRDEFCCDLYYKFENLIPMVGICRGAQFLCVMSGGSLYQHVDKHTSAHDAKDCSTGEVIKVTSTHHQMMIPPSDGEIILIAELGGKKEPQMLHDRQPLVDVEAVYFSHNNVLCYQPHPEFVQKGEDCQEFFFTCIDQYLL